MFPDNYLNELLDEKVLVNPSTTAHSFRLLLQEIDKVKCHQIAPTPLSPEFKEEVIKLSEKIFLPVEEYRGFDFVGKIIGPNGSTIQGIQTSAHCKILIRGRGSPRDQKGEEETRGREADIHEHLKEPLHLLIQTEGPKSDAYGNIADALSKLNDCFAIEDKLSHTEDYTRNDLSRGPEDKLRYTDDYTRNDLSRRPEDKLRYTEDYARSDLSRGPEDKLRYTEDYTRSDLRLGPEDKLRYPEDHPRSDLRRGPEDRGESPYTRVLMYGVPPPGAIIVNEPVSRNDFSVDSSYHRSHDSSIQDSPYGLSSERYHKQRETTSFEASRPVERRATPPYSFPVRRR